jgi:hypothetical protein
MSHKMPTIVICTLLACVCLASTGCVRITAGNSLGPLGIPIPVSPYFQKMKEDHHWEAERYDNVPILGPIVPGGPAAAYDEPTDDEVMRAFEKAKPTQGGFPLLHEIQRNDVKIVKELIADYIDPPRVYPLIGPAQLHHAHYKCTIYYNETTRVGWPIPHTLRDEDAVEVIYIDHNHFHMVGNVDPGTSPNY